MTGIERIDRLEAFCKILAGPYKKISPPHACAWDVFCAEYGNATPEPGDLTEDELSEISGKTVSFIGFWPKFERLVAEVRRRRKQERIESLWPPMNAEQLKQACGEWSVERPKEQPKSPHEHKWENPKWENPIGEYLAYGVRQASWRCSCGATKTERIEEPK